MLRRDAVSRIQLVVALLIAVLLVGLILSAVVQIRQESNRQICRNNLKQLGLGVHNYTDTYDCLPPLTDQGEGA